MIALSAETGTLGVRHLKRYWSRVRAGRAGAQIDAEAESAMDATLLCGLYLGLHETISYLNLNTPSFEEFEAWVLQINGGSIDASRAARLNSALAGTIDRGAAPADGPLSSDDLAFWDEHGYVILNDAVTSDQCAIAAQAIYEYLAVDPLDSATWYRNPAGHTIWVNLLRHPAFQANRHSARVHGAFAQIWGRTDLWPTIDQGGFNPPETAEWRFPGPHLHWDTSIAQPLPLGTQGILYLTDTDANQGAFTCVPGFQRCIGEWLAGLAPDTDPRSASVLNTLPAIPIAGRAGDLIIWHAALPHGSSPNRSHRPRVAQYVNLRPSEWDVNPIWR